MDVDKALSIIDTLQRSWYVRPTDYHIKRVHFEYESYKCSAIEEIKMYILKRKDMNVFSTIEDFRYHMNTLACCAKNDTVCFMFSIYYEVATDVLDELVNFGK